MQLSLLLSSHQAEIKIVDSLITQAHVQFTFISCSVFLNLTIFWSFTKLAKSGSPLAIGSNPSDIHEYINLFLC